MISVKCLVIKIKKKLRLVAQWGLKQKPNESYIDYVKRVKQSNLWKSKDNGFYDLTREGATDLNRKTSLNPNIVYKTYTGEATHKALNSDRQKADFKYVFSICDYW